MKTPTHLSKPEGPKGIEGLYRLLFSSYNPLKNGRFVFQGPEEGETKPPPAEVEPKGAPEATDTTTEELAVPLTGEKNDIFDQHAQTVNKIIKEFQITKEGEETEEESALRKKLMGEAQDKFKDLRAEYQQELGIAQKAKTKISNKIILDLTEAAKEHIVKIRERIEKQEDTIPEEAKEAEAKPESAELSPKQLQKATRQLKKMLAEQFKKLKFLPLEGEEKGLADLLDDPNSQEAINKLVKSLSKDQLKLLSDGKNISLDKGNVTALTNVLRSSLKIEKKDPEEIKLVQGIRLGEEGKEKSFENIFGKDSKIPEMLSQLHTITKEGEDGTVKIGNQTIESWSDIKKLLPTEDMRNADITEDEGKEDLNKLATKHLEGLGKINGSIGAIEKGLLAEVEKGGGKIEGGFGKIFALIQLIMGALKALKTGDTSTAMDMFRDYQEGRNPAESQNESKKAYAEALTNKKDLGQLLEAYLNPTGSAANTLFGNKNALGRYRSIAAKPALLNHITTSLSTGLNKISSIKELANGNTQIDGYKKGGTHVSVELWPGKGDQLTGEIIYYKTKSEKVGKETKKVEIRDVITPISEPATFDSINATLTEEPKAVPPKPAPKPKVAKKPPEKPKEKPEEKEQKKVEKALEGQNNWKKLSRMVRKIRTVLKLGSSNEFNNLILSQKGVRKGTSAADAFKKFSNEQKVNVLRQYIESKVKTEAEYKKIA